MKNPIMNSINFSTQSIWRLNFIYQSNPFIHIKSIPKKNFRSVCVCVPWCRRNDGRWNSADFLCIKLDNFRMCVCSNRTKPNQICYIKLDAILVSPWWQKDRDNSTMDAGCPWWDFDRDMDGVDPTRLDQTKSDRTNKTKLHRTENEWTN